MHESNVKVSNTVSCPKRYSKILPFLKETDSNLQPSDPKSGANIQPQLVDCRVENVCFVAKCVARQ